MAHSLSARKRMRQNAKNRARNRWRNTKLHEAVKKLLAATHAGGADEARKQLPGLYKLIDQVAAKGTIHRNTAARYKARLTARVNALGKGKKAA